MTEEQIKLIEKLDMVSDRFNGAVRTFKTEVIVQMMAFELINAGLRAEDII